MVENDDRGRKPSTHDDGDLGLELLNLEGSGTSPYSDRINKRPIP